MNDPKPYQSLQFYTHETLFASVSKNRKGLICLQLRRLIYKKEHNNGISFYVSEEFINVEKVNPLFWIGSSSKKTVQVYKKLH